MRDKWESSSFTAATSACARQLSPVEWLIQNSQSSYLRLQLGCPCSRQRYETGLRPGLHLPSFCLLSIILDAASLGALPQLLGLIQRGREPFLRQPTVLLVLRQSARLQERPPTHAYERVRCLHDDQNRRSRGTEDSRCESSTGRSSTIVVIRVIGPKLQRGVAYAL